MGVVDSMHGEVPRYNCKGSIVVSRTAKASADSCTMSDAMMTATANQSPDEWWVPSDLLFLKLALEHGMTCAEVAGFLSRDEDEVRKKAKQMKISYGRLPRYYHYRL